MTQCNDEQKQTVRSRYYDYFQVARYASNIKKEILIRVLLGILLTGIYVLQAICIANMIHTVLYTHDLHGVMTPILIVIVGILMRAILVNYIEGYSKKMGGKIKTVLREKIMDQLLQLGPSYQMDKRAGRFQSLVTDGVEYLEPFFALFIPQFFIVLCSVLPMVIYLFTISKLAGVIVLISVIVCMTMPHIMMPFYAKANIDYWSDYASLNSSFIDTMQGMNTLKLFNAEIEKGKQLEEISEQFRVKQLMNTRNSLVTTGVITFASAMATTVATVIVACQDGILVSSILFVFFLTLECIRPVGELNTAWHSSMMGFSVVGELLEILNTPIQIKDEQNALTSHLDEGLPQIQFQDVTFRYSEKREQALEHLNLEIPAGKTVAIVGLSGAGKSTLVNLLLRFYDCNQGEILIGDNPIQAYQLEYLRSKIAVVFQNTYLFYGTVKDNLRIANPNASDEEMISAAKAANAHDFIMELPNGYDSIVGERGNTLSGGQRQRISIARAILKNTSILIMDEATSSVDAESEAMIRQTLEQLQGKYTMILIAHRLSTIQHAEKIVVMDHGSVVESGTHEELLAKKGLYCELIEAQRGGQHE